MSSNTEIIQAIQGLRAMLESLEARVSSVTAAPKVSTAPATEQTKTEPKQKREISEATKAWNTYVDKVKEDMLSSGWKHPETGKIATRKDAMQEASKRRPTDPDAPKPAEAKPKPKPKAAAGPSHPATADGEAEAKPKAPRKPMSEESKAKAAATRKANAERKKAEAEAAKASTEVTTQPTPTTSYPPLPPSPPASEDEGETLTPINIKAKRYLLNPHTNGCWKRKADGSKGEWAGVYAKVDGKDTIDTSVGERAFD